MHVYNCTLSCHTVESSRKTRETITACRFMFLPRCTYASEVLWWATVHLSDRLSVCQMRALCDKTKAPSEKSSIMTNKKSTTSFAMSLRWTLYPASKPPKGIKKRKVTVFAGFRSVSLRKSATKLLCAKPVSSRVVRHLLAYLSVHK